MCLSEFELCYLENEMQATAEFELATKQSSAAEQTQHKGGNISPWGEVLVFPKGREGTFPHEGEFWIPQPKLHGAMYLVFFVKPKMVSFDQFLRFFLIFGSVSYL